MAVTSIDGGAQEADRFLWKSVMEKKRKARPETNARQSGKRVPNKPGGVKVKASIRVGVFIGRGSGNAG